MQAEKDIKSSRAKRRLPFTETTKTKVPRLQFVTKLDKVKEAHGKSSKEVKNIVWARSKLEDKEAWLKALSKKPEKIATIIFDALLAEEGCGGYGATAGVSPIVHKTPSKNHYLNATVYQPCKRSTKIY